MVVSIWHNAAQAFAVGFPPLLQCLLFWLFASLVVHVCQRLVEHTAFSVDPSSRRISASHAALCIGCIVWALDVVGLFMYAELAHHAAALDLVPALSGLVIMVVSARLTIPTLSTGASKARIAVAGLCLAVGMLVAHFTITRDQVQDFASVNWTAIALAFAIAIGGRLTDRLEPAPIIVAGLGLFALSSFLLASAGPFTGFTVLALWLVIGRAGLGMLIPALNVGAVQSLSGTELAYASSAVNFVRQLGGAAGVNLLAVVLEWRSATVGATDAARPFHECFAIVTLAFAAAIVPAWSIRKHGR
jgi:MFS family permease